MLLSYFSQFNFIPQQSPHVAVQTTDLVKNEISSVIYVSCIMARVEICK